MVSIAENRLEAQRAELDEVQRSALVLAAVCRRACGREQAQSERARVLAIVAFVAANAGYTLSDLLGRSQRREVSDVRHLAAWFARRATRATLQTVGDVLGGRDHGTVLCSVAAVEDRLATEPAFAAHVEDVRAVLGMAGLWPEVGA